MGEAGASPLSMRKEVRFISPMPDEHGFSCSRLLGAARASGLSDLADDDSPPMQMCSPEQNGSQNLVFPVTVKLADTSIPVDGRAIKVSPGMATTVEIKTGDRRILEYVFSPLVETAAIALRER